MAYIVLQEMKIWLQLTTAFVSTLLAAYAIAVAFRNGAKVTNVGGDVYAGMFAIPAFLLILSWVALRFRGPEIRPLKIASFSMPTIVLLIWVALVATDQVTTHAELMKRGRTSRVAPTGHKHLNFVSIALQSRRWAHI